ncbi:hypothetical protein [Ramlibacter sp. 2FC]|uniref:hypothetical protein n=1 Tax=Ramlibacter sp. 2FC TaxID=2502188 RepID=UPI0010F53109|nr:hypothetical protein [Ramlibacter sp. 2FC]
MNFADAISTTQTAAALAARMMGGPFAAGFANFLLGQASFTAQLADLGQKIQDGTAMPSDYADVFQAGGNILTGLGVMTGLAGPVTLGVWTAVGIGLFVYKYKEEISETWNALGTQPYQWKYDLPADFQVEIDRQAQALFNPFDSYDTNSQINGVREALINSARHPLASMKSMSYEG